MHACPFELSVVHAIYHTDLKLVTQSERNMLARMQTEAGQLLAAAQELIRIYFKHACCLKVLQETSAARL